MAITKASNHLACDRRWNNWCKHIRRPADIDLTKDRGYCLPTRFIDFDQAVALAPGEFLVCAAETGSRRTRSYDYALVGCAVGNLLLGRDGENSVQIMDDASIRDQLAEAAQDGRVSEEQYAKALNSPLYRYALWIMACAWSEAVPATPPLRRQTYSLAEVRDGTGWPKGARFALVTEGEEVHRA